eukprot:5907873-Pyramimonas_sp.AAC.1
MDFDRPQGCVFQSKCGMGLAWAAKFFNLDADSAASVRSCGVSLAPFRVGRGVRQGRPAPAPLLAFALGPVC